MDFSSLSGLFVVVGIGVALTMFVPAWAKRSQTVQEVREITRSVKLSARAQVAARERAIRHTTLTSAQLAQKLARLAKTRQVLAFVFLGSLPVALIAAFSLSTLWMVALGGAAVSVVSLTANRALAKRQQELSVDRRAVRSVPARSFRELYREVAPEVAVAPVAEDRTWTPRHMPAPLHTGHIGSLEQPVLAEVKAIRETASGAAIAPSMAEKSETSVPVGEKLDEILRRRRAV
jgi:hypothetical protein